MNGPTHLAFGLLSLTGALAVAGIPLASEPAALAAAAGASLLPDVDTPHSAHCPPRWSGAGDTGRPRTDWWR
jgi:membrane-bound metal-dependent hydrolase YbcI (DUF457 family)